MSEKIYCKDCRFYENGLCHRVPPQVIFVGEGARENSFPRSAPDCWCGAAEREEVAEKDFTTGKPGDYAGRKKNRIDYLESENNRLRKLICEIRDFLINGAIPGYVHLKQECIRKIYTIAHQEDQKQRQE